MLLGALIVAATEPLSLSPEPGNVDVNVGCGSELNQAALASFLAASAAAAACAAAAAAAACWSISISAAVAP